MKKRSARRDNLEGRRFTRLLVLSFSHKNERGELFWNCRCDCGTEKVVKAGTMRRGHALSCGCYHKEAVTLHGMTGTPTFGTWRSMLERCSNPRLKVYRIYGARGISVCQRWRHSFANFLADMGNRPSGTSLDRIDVNGNYEPSNCRWATSKQQQRNRRDRRTLTHEGVTMSLYDWADRTGIPAKVIGYRVGSGWPIDRALSLPIMKRGKRKD